MDENRDWRTSVRWGVGLVGLVLSIFVLVTTFADRVDSGSKLDRATLNIGLYTERLFFLGVILTAMVAVYIFTRADE